jgi:hypothetical protein
MSNLGCGRTVEPRRHYVRVDGWNKVAGWVVPRRALGQAASPCFAAFIVDLLRLQLSLADVRVFTKL